jgi:hypothetical protein
MPMSQLSKKIPILFIIFNRPAVALESFQAIRRYKPERLYLAADGPRPDKTDDRSLCEKTRELIVKQIDWDCEVKKLFRNENVGCGRGPSEAITWMFETEEYGAIIEDDCVVSDDYFRFCEELLPKYKDDDRIGQINCWVPRTAKQESNTYYFTGYPEITAWATWRRAWKNIDFEMKHWKAVRLNIFSRFPFLEACIHFYLWGKVYRLFQRGIKPDGWDYQWSIYIFMWKKLCIEPNVNLVRNIGFVAGSTHCEDTDNPLAKTAHGSLAFPLVHPDEIAWDRAREKRRSHTYCMYYVKLLLRKVKRALQ